ncbi:MAG: Hsp70 family protein [Spirochaetia bacterium]|nr:Hsp70 family protein [Spirochaetia bacterium]
MNNPTIGIKIADGSYFPIMEEGSSKRKRLVLTTVNDNQENVQIDLYKGNGEQLQDAVYVGSLLIENIVQGPKESSEIELKIGFDQDGTLNAEAGDPGSGQFESLSISIEKLAESAMYETPDFSLDDESEELTLEDDFGQDSELESEELSLNEDDFDFDDIEDESTQASEDFVLDLDNEEIPEDDFEEKSDDIQEDFDDYTPGILSESEKIQRKEKKGGNPFIIALLVIVAIAAIAGISYLLFRSLQGEDSPELEANSNTEENSPAPVQEVSVVAVPEVQAVPPEISTTDAVPQTESTDEEHQSDESTKVSELSVQENTKIADTTGVWYKIRWGDTLWGISYSFYNSPKDYNDIVNENKIRNPDIIFAETKIFIPAKK